MKMKKLTALALAGVLCLGMSTTAFAAKSPVPADAANEKDQGNVNVDSITDVNSGLVTDWEIREGETAEEASVRIQDDVEDMIKDFERLKRDTTSLDVAAYAEKALAELNKLDGTKLQLITSADITYAGDDADRDFSKDPLTVRFDLTGRNVKPGDKISIMHEVTDENGFTYWTVLTDVVVKEYKDTENPKNNMYYVDYDFTSFSDVVLLKQLSDGTNTVIPGDDYPTDPTAPTNPTDTPNLTPDANGNITVDQLVDLIVGEIQKRENATTVVRTAVSGKVSPKTGE